MAGSTKLEPSALRSKLQRPNHGIMAESLAQFFLEHFRAHQKECAFRQRRGYRMESFTYGEILNTACSFTRTLESRGIVKGDRVMIWGENRAEWVAAFVGCALSGVVAVPMDDGASSEFALRVFHKVEAKLLVGSRRHAQECQAVGASLETLNFEDLNISDLNISDLHIKDLPQTAAHPACAPSKVSLGRDDILQIVFTSGTTAEPRGVVITHGNVLANIAPLEREMHAYLKYERLVHPLRFLNLLSLSHVFGQFLGIFVPPLLGATVIFQEELKPSEVVRDRKSVV